MGLFKKLRSIIAVAKVIAPNSKEVAAADEVEQAAEAVRDVVKKSPKKP